MTLPGNLTTITLTGTYLDSTGAPESGTLQFLPPPELVDLNTAILYSKPVIATLNGSGSFSVTLICTDNPTLLPAGWSYTVTEYVAGTRSYQIYLPSSLGSSTDISEHIPLPLLAGGSQLPSTSAVAPGYGALAYNNTWTGTNTFTGSVVSTSADARYVQRANNLSDLASASSARTSLGLGTAAVAAINTTNTTIAPIGTRNAGSTGQVADAGHVHASNSNIIQCAAPTGVAASDQAAINAAIAALPSGGGTVQLQAGTYVVQAPSSASNGCVVMNVNNSTLAGMGMDVTTIQYQAAATGGVTGIVRTPSGVANSNISFRDFTIDGNNANQTIPAPTSGYVLVIGFYCGVTPNNTATDTDITLSNVKVINTSGYGFDPHERTTRLIMTHCRAENVGLDNVHDGFTLDAQYDATLTGCVAVSPGRHGFNLVTANSGTILNGCHSISAGGNGITLQNGSKNCTVVNCVVESPTLDGIQVVGTEQTGSQQDLLPGWNNTIKNNTILSPGAHGIHLIAVPNATVTGNTIRDVNQSNGGSNGIYCDEGSGTPLYTTGCVIANNDIGVTTGATYAPKYGIAEKSASESNWIVGNNSVGAGTAQFNLLGSALLSTTAHNGITGTHPSTFAYASDSPANHGLLEWNYPPQGIGSTTSAITSGTVYFIALQVQNTDTLGHVALYLGTVGATLTAAQSLVGLYTISGGVATLQQSSADQSTTWSTAGNANAESLVALASGVPVTAGQTVIIGVLSVGTTGPCFGRAAGASGAPSNVGLSKSSPLLFATYGTTGQTALPGSFTLNSASFTQTNSIPIWGGLS